MSVAELKPVSAKWQMPDVQIGQFVEWMRSMGDKDPTLAIVIKIEHDTDMEQPARNGQPACVIKGLRRSLVVLPLSRNQQIIPREGCRHIDDPALRRDADTQKMLMENHGCWRMLEKQPFVTHDELQDAAERGLAARRGPGRPRKEDADE